MNQSAPLAGLRVLVVEDDYYLADDAQRALEAAGAKVLGPCSDGEAGVKLALEGQASCAVLDINTGGGPTFGPARALLAAGVPIIFVTGYDTSVIPTELRHVPCLHKPTNARRLVNAVQLACAS